MEKEFWTETDIISTYTRAQAIEDGVLVDVSGVAKEAGFRYPVVVSRAVWNMIENIPPKYQGIQNVQGRLWDVLYMARLAAKRGGRIIEYKLLMHHGRKAYVTLKAVCGPGDEGEPVVTIMLPEED